MSTSPRRVARSVFASFASELVRPEGWYGPIAFQHTVELPFIDAAVIALGTESRQHETTRGNVGRLTLEFEASSGRGGDFFGRLGLKRDRHETEAGMHEAKPSHVGDFTMESER